MKVMAEVSMIHDDDDDDDDNDVMMMIMMMIIIIETMEQGNLDGANIFRLFHHVTKSSESETKGIKSCRDNQR